MMVAFIDEQREAHGVEPICEVLPIAPSTYYHWKACESDPSKWSARVRRDAEMLAHIYRVWESNYQVDGAPKVWKQLRREGIRVAAVRWSV